MKHKLLGSLRRHVWKTPEWAYREDIAVMTPSGRWDADMRRSRWIAERHLSPVPGGVRTFADLRRCCAHPERDLPPGGQLGIGRRQMQHDSPDRALDRQREFAKAREAFCEGATCDARCVVFMARCEHFIAQPQAPNWDGAWVSREK